MNAPHVNPINAPLFADSIFGQLVDMFSKGETVESAIECLDDAFCKNDDGTPALNCNELRQRNVRLALAAQEMYAAGWLEP